MPIVMVFARAPRLGTVKRRLAREAGERAALRFHLAQLARVLRTFRADRRFRTVLALTPKAARGPWRGAACVAGQGDGDLGRRMAHAFRRFPRRPVVLVGCDIPDMGADDVALALRHLRGCHAVFGPAEDGGYWLVAMGSCRPARPFAGVRWSSPHALSDTLANFAGRRIAFLRTLSDVDTAADLARTSSARRKASARPLAGHDEVFP